MLDPISTGNSQDAINQVMLSQLSIRGNMLTSIEKKYSAVQEMDDHTNKLRPLLHLAIMLTPLSVGLLVLQQVISPTSYY